MTHKQAIQARERLLKRLPPSSEILRGSLIERTTHHTSGCPKCARGEGHPQTVLTISYPGGRTRQFSIHSEEVPQVRQWLSNYQELKSTIEARMASSVTGLPAMRASHSRISFNSLL